MTLSREYPLEMAAEKIVDPRSKEYFAEVIGCYNGGYYRSAIVMLWSVVVCDLLYKLDVLANSNNDATAKGILTEIEQDRQNNPDSPKWEEKLLNLTNDRTDVFDRATYLNLQTVQKHRHLSAHPVLTENDALYSPTREIARAHLRSALEGLLTKPPFMSGRVFDSFLEDLEAHRELLLVDDTSVGTYVESKYVKHFSGATEDDVFRRLWKIVFRVTGDQRAEDNRVVNFQALLFLFQRRASVAELLDGDPEYYSDCRFEADVSPLLGELLALYPGVYPKLSQAFQRLMKNYVESDFVAWAKATYLSGTAENHKSKVVDQIKEKREDADLSRSQLKGINEFYERIGDFDAAKAFAIQFYASSPLYDSADAAFRHVVKPMLDRFTKSDFENLFQKSDGNSQTYDRRRAKRDHRVLHEAIQDARIDFDFDKYPNMKESIGDHEYWEPDPEDEDIDDEDVF